MNAKLLLGCAWSLGLAIVACGGAGGADESGTSQQDATADIRSLQAIDGTDKFVVICKYHTAADTPEIVTANDILANNVCSHGSDGPPAAICSYDNGKFRVVVNGIVHERNIGPVSNAKVACTPKGSGVFNGDKLYVFTAQSGTFSQYTPSYGATDPKLFGTDRGLVLVGDSTLAVHDFDTSTIQASPSSLTKIASFDPVIDTVGGAFLFYDGAVVHGYCGAKWVAANRVAPRAEAPVQISSRGSARVMEFVDFAFALDPAACTLSRDFKTPRTASGGSPEPCAHSSSNGSYGEGGGCSSNGCWSAGGGCSSNGCWRAGGGCSSNGCWGPGGGCSSNGCWQAGGGCSSNGCWMAGGSCSSNGCTNGSPSFPYPDGPIVCRQ